MNTFSKTNKVVESIDIFIVAIFYFDAMFVRYVAGGSAHVRDE